MIAAVSTVYAIIFAINAWSPFHAQPGRRANHRRFWVWLSRRKRQSCVALAMVGLLISTACLSAAVQSHKSRRSVDRPSKTVVPPAAAAAPAQAPRPGLVDQLVSDHQQAVATDRISQWQDQLINVGPRAVDLVLPLLAHTSDLRLKSDVLFCLQEAGGVDLGIRRGQGLTAGQVDAAVGALNAARR